MRIEINNPSSSSSGSGSGLPDASGLANGSILVVTDGAWGQGITEDPKGNSFAAQDGLSGASVAAESVTASADGHTAELAPDTFTMDTVELSRDVHFAGIAANTNLSALNPVVDNSDARFSNIPSADEKAAIVGTSGTAVSASNKLVDNADTRLSRIPTSDQDAAFDANADLSATNPVAAQAMKEIIQAATDTLTAAECKNTIINNYGQTAENTQTFPAAAAGLSFLVFISAAGAGAWHGKAGAGDKIYLDGTALDDGDKVSLATPAVGNCAAFFCVQTGAAAYDWYCNTISGVWSDGGS